MSAREAKVEALHALPRGRSPFYGGSSPVNVHRSAFRWGISHVFIPPLRYPILFSVLDISSFLPALQHARLVTQRAYNDQVHRYRFLLNLFLPQGLEVE